MRALVSTASILVAGSFLLSGCSNSNDTSSPNRDSVETNQPGPATETTLTHEWTDSDGYKYRWTVEDPHLKADTEIADQKPGEALLRLVMTGSVKVQNLTTGRNAPAVNLPLMAAWPKGSAMCAAIEEGSPAPGEYCFLNGPKDIRADSGQSTSLERIPVDAEIEGAYVSDQSMITTVIQESSIDELTIAAEAPAFWGLGAASATLTDNEKALNDCRGEGAYYVVAATRTDVCGAGISTQPSAEVLQPFSGTWTGTYTQSGAANLVRIDLTVNDGNLAGTALYGSTCTTTLKSPYSQGSTIAITETTDSYSPLCRPQTLLLTVDGNSLSLSIPNAYVESNLTRAGAQAGSPSSSTS